MLGLRRRGGADCTAGGVCGAAGGWGAGAGELGLRSQAHHYGGGTSPRGQGGCSVRLGKYLDMYKTTSLKSVFITIWTKTYMGNVHVSILRC